MTLKEVRERIKGLDPETAKKIVCALVGHSRIQTYCFGYWSCARCGDQLGDSLGGSYDATDVVLVGHDCKVCRETFARLTWKDTFLSPENPLEKRDD